MDDLVTKNLNETPSRKKKRGRPSTLPREKIIAALKQGSSYRKIAGEFKCSQSSVASIAMDSGLNRGKEANKKRIQKRIKFQNYFRRGIVSHKGIAREEECTKQNIQKKLGSLGLGDRRKAYIKALRNRREREGRYTIEQLENLTSTIALYALSRAEEEGVVRMKALEYHFSILKRDSNNVSIEKLETLFEHYFNPTQELTIEYLAGVSGISIQHINPIISRVGLPKLNMKGMRRRTRPQRELVKRGIAESRFATPDLAYFLEESPENLSHMSKSIDTEVEKYSRMIDGVGRSNPKNVSQIYEAQDAGFNLAETQQLLGNSIKLEDIGRILDQRSSLEPLIVSELNSLFNGYQIEGEGIKIATPYVPTNVRLWYRENFKA